MSKYQALTNHLRRQPLTHSRYPIAFADIEKIIEGELPPSAHRYRAWWSNNPSNNVMTKAWLDAGWITSDVDLEGQKLTFRRIPYRHRNRQPATNLEAGAHSLLLRGLNDETMAFLKLRAEATGQAVEELAAAILAAHARPSLQERLTIADRIRSSGSKLHHLDIPAMIREDRDRR